MIEVARHADGAVLPVRAQPGARTTGIKGERAGRLLVAVNQPPDKGRANAAIRRVLSRAFDIPTRQIELLSGAGTRDKRFLFRDADPGGLGAAVAAICSADPDPR